MSAATSHRRVYAAILLAALLLAGVGSYYASSHPDGLNYVAEKTGFIESEKTDGPSADSPLAGYSTKGVDDERLSGGLAGVAGVALTLSIGGLLFLGLRRRGASAGDTAPAEAPTADRA